MNWQPIETAPKDGTRIDLWINSKRYADVHWVSVTCGGVEDPNWSYWGYEGSVGQSFLPNTLSRDLKPTHWMPLPQPPEAKDD